MKKLRTLLLAVSLSGFATGLSAAPAVVAPGGIGIGGGETDTHTHLRFEGIPKDAKIVKVSTRLVVEKVGPTRGSSFFAIQVDFWRTRLGRTAATSSSPAASSRRIGAAS